MKRVLCPLLACLVLSALLAPPLLAQTDDAAAQNAGAARPPVDGRDGHRARRRGLAQSQGHAVPRAHRRLLPGAAQWHGRRVRRLAAVSRRHPSGGRAHRLPHRQEHDLPRQEDRRRADLDRRHRLRGHLQGQDHPAQRSGRGLLPPAGPLHRRRWSATGSRLPASWSSTTAPAWSSAAWPTR